MFLQILEHKLRDGFNEEVSGLDMFQMLNCLVV